MANMAGRGPATQDVGGSAARGTDRGRGFATHDLPIIGAGILALISSFLPWFGATYHGYTYGYPYGAVRTLHASSNAWNSGALAWVPIVLMLIAAAIAAASLLTRGRLRGLGGIGPSTAIAALSALSLLLIVVRWISLPHLNANYGGFATVSSGARVGLILGFIASILMTLFAIRRLKASGERFPGQRDRGEYDREAALGGYGGGGADRTRALDRERQYAGREHEPRDQYGTAAPSGERLHPDDRGGHGSDARHDVESGRGMGPGQGSMDPGRGMGPGQGMDGPQDSGDRFEDQERRWDR